jgi:hypothetical protein
MPFNVQHDAMVKNVTEKQPRSSSRTPSRKAPGTRVGLLFDWRGESTNSAKLVDRYGRSVRDGK